jgi:hypothetical protein
MKQGWKWSPEFSAKNLTAIKARGYQPASRRARLDRNYPGKEICNELVICGLTLPGVSVCYTR